MKKFALTVVVEASINLSFDVDNPIEAETIAQAREFAIREAKEAMLCGEFDFDSYHVIDIEELGDVTEKENENDN